MDAGDNPSRRVMRHRGPKAAGVRLFSPVPARAPTPPIRSRFVQGTGMAG